MTIHLTADETAAANRVESSMRSMQIESLSNIELAYQQPRQIRDRRRKNILKFITSPKVQKTPASALKVHRSPTTPVKVETSATETLSQKQ